MDIEEGVMRMGKKGLTCTVISSIPAPVY